MSRYSEPMTASDESQSANSLRRFGFFLLRIRAHSTVLEYEAGYGGHCYDQRQQELMSGETRLH